MPAPLNAVLPPPRALYRLAMVHMVKGRALDCIGIPHRFSGWVHDSTWKMRKGDEFWVGQTSNAKSQLVDLCSNVHGFTGYRSLGWVSALEESLREESFERTITPSYWLSAFSSSHCHYWRL